MLGWIATGFCLLGIYAFIIERHWLEIRQIRISLEDLPSSFDGIKMVLFSDTHLGFFYQPKQLSLLVQQIQSLNPDIVCFAGDLLNDRRGLGILKPSSEVLAQLQAPLGKFAVVGNHDYCAGVKEVKQALKKGGFRVLQNEHHVIRRGKNSLTIIGLDDVLEGSPHLHKAVKGAPSNDCKILLVHEPDMALQSLPISSCLQLSGHSHGGQVRIPFWGPILTTRMGKKLTDGLNLGKNGLVYTSRGIGTTHLPIRFCCRPEVTVITLTSGSCKHSTDL